MDAWILISKFFQTVYTPIPDQFIPDLIYNGDLNFAAKGRCGDMAFAALVYYYYYYYPPLS